MHDGQRFLAAHGGASGVGNQHYATSANQAPRKHKDGDKGQEARLVLELKMIAQAGLIGMPNAGKSTLLANLTKATPRIAPYPFTTLSPNLGVMEVDNPAPRDAGRHPGPHRGGLSRGRPGRPLFCATSSAPPCWSHLVAPPDDYAHAEDDPEAAMESIGYAYKLVRHELEAYSEKMAGKPEVVVLTKIDLLDEAQREIYLEGLRRAGTHPVAISAVAGEGLEPLKDALVLELDALGMIAQDGARPAPVNEEQEILDKKDLRENLA